jgi:Tfp pilus assembly protein PilF
MKVRVRNLVVLAVVGCALLSSFNVKAASDSFQPQMPVDLVAKVNDAKEKQVNGRDLDLAAAELRDVLTKQPNYYRALFNLGLIYQSQGKADEALQTLLKAKQIRDENHIPDSAILNTVGWAYLAAGKLDAAESALLEALKEQPQNSPTNERVLNNLGYLYLQKGETDKAKSFLRQSLDTYHSDGARNVWKLVEELEQAQTQGAKQIPSLISQIDVDNSQTRLQAVNALAFSSRYPSSDVINAVLARLESSTDSPLSMQGRVNCLTILARRSHGSWTTEQLTRAQAVLANEEKQKLGPPEKYTVGELKKALEKVVVVQPSQ